MLTRARLFLALLAPLLCGFLASAEAKTPVASHASAKPQTEALEVSADGSLEWYKDTHLYVARGGAKAVKGDLTVTADVLSAHERQPDTGLEKNEAAKPAKEKEKTGRASSETGPSKGIDRLMAEGHVHLWDAHQQVFGDKAVYDLDKAVAQITGNDLKYMTQKEVVTAQESLEYYDHEQMAVARGHAVAVRDGRHIEGDVLTAHFTQTTDGQREMSVLTAQGHATVITGDTVARSDEVVYDVKRNVAVLSGTVRVTRGQTQISGDKAEVDFATGESRMLNEKPNGRVKALLVPDQSQDHAKGKSGPKKPLAKSKNRAS